MKNKNRVQTKRETRQRMRIKIILRAGAAAAVLLIVGLTIFFQVSQKKVQAIDEPANWVIVNDQAYVTETSVPAPVITHEAAGPNTFQYRKVKTISSN